MKIFISWSGPKSKEMSEIMVMWLPLIFPHLEFFVSTDIEKGANFLEKILKQLQEASLGLFLLTRGNVSAQWVQFEAGAFASKGIGSKIFPLWLDDEIEIDDTGPLKFYQGSLINEKDIFMLIDSINNSLDVPHDKDRLRRLFNSNKNEFFYNWEKIINIPSTDRIGLRNNRDLLLTILNVVNDSRTTTEKVHREIDRLIPALEEQYGREISKKGGLQPPPVIHADIRPCTFENWGEMEDKGSRYFSKFPYGGHFTSEEAWLIALGEMEFEYKSLE